MEIFKPINVEGLEGYQISNLGKVSNGKKIMKDFFTSDGYKRICLQNNGKPKKYMVHRLVAFTFIGYPECEKMQINHINCIRDDNNFNNLEWVSVKDNIMHAIKYGYMSLERIKKQAKYANEMACKVRRKKIKITYPDGNFEVYESAVEAEYKTGISRRSLGAVARGENKSYKGILAEYI